jgi:hypothetical protein
MTFNLRKEINVVGENKEDTTSTNEGLNRLTSVKQI